MSYHGYGLVGLYSSGIGAVGECGVNSAKNPATGKCECIVGHTWVDASSDTNYDCKPFALNAPCPFPGQRRNPIDLSCNCPPGQRVPAGPTGTACLPQRPFPDCKDASGQRVPNCILGLPMKETAMAVGAGAVLGLLLGRLLG